MKTIDSIESISFLPALPLKLGMKQRLEGQTRHERRDDFMDNSIILNLFFSPCPAPYPLSCPKKTKRAQKEEGDPKREWKERRRKSLL